MSKLMWDKTGEHYYETGVDRVVLYPYANGTYGKGVAWSGVTSVSESPSGAEASPIYADNIKYLNLMSAEELGISIEAYQSPEEFDACDGSVSIGTGVTIGQQTRSMFGLSYRSLIGNDVDSSNHGYNIHLIYGCLASPSEKGHSTVNESPEAMTLSWEISTSPVDVPGFKPTASVEIDSTKVDPAKLADLEAILYGTDSDGDTEATDARLPLPAEIIELFKTEEAAG